MRQHATPLIVHDDGGARPLMPVAFGQHGWPEATIQDLVHRFPECLPIREIDPAFTDPVPICTELNTPVGPIDNLLVTPAGLPMLVECKLWSNPESRRKVVAQILDYAKELVRWTAADLQREASKRLGEPGNPLLARVRAAGHDVDETDFNDALTRNLRIGPACFSSWAKVSAKVSRRSLNISRITPGRTSRSASSRCRSTTCLMGAGSSRRASSPAPISFAARDRPAGQRRTARSGHGADGHRRGGRRAVGSRAVLEDVRRWP